MDDFSSEYSGLEIAVIGMSGRFPGAHNVNELWDLLKQGKEGISFFDQEQLQSAGRGEKTINASNFVPAKGIIHDIEYFDNEFFGYSERESQLLDPQVRILLECTWEALEDAGYDPFRYSKRMGMFAGANPNLYWTFGTYFSGKNDIGDYANKDLISTRISYKLDLKGPSYTVFTACSTSLVTIHQACRSLLGGECEMAVAGGISIELPQVDGYYHQEGMILSKDGHHRSFDKNATGAVFSNGAGMVILKPLEDALKDHDNIYAVIKGTAVNNDGKRKVGYTAPSMKGQVEVIQDALQISGVDPKSIQYVEAHGSATALGDPIEVKALQRAFNIDAGNFCGIGSIKSNLGHLNIASGVAGFIKAVLVVKNKWIPPTVHFEAPNPKIDFDNSPFYVVKEGKSLNTTYPARVGVSSMGVGGTNAHAIIEEAPKVTHEKRVDRPVLIRFSAQNDSSLGDYRDKLADFITSSPQDLADISYTLQVGRHDFNHRQFVVCSEPGEAAGLLSQDADIIHRDIVDPDAKPYIVFMFPGQGAQYVNMGLDLYHHLDHFREEVDRGLDIIHRQTGHDLRETWFNKDNLPFDRDPINQTQNTQPLLFVFEYALCKTMIHLGIEPRAMIGHSFGEYVAACISGVFSLEDALRLVICRGQLIASLPGHTGTMMSVSVKGSELASLLPRSLDIAAINSSQSCVVAGESEEIRKFKIKLEADGYSCRVLRISNAFHSRMMDPVLETFRSEFDTIHTGEPKIPFISNLTGEWASFDEIKSPQYWVNHLRETVRFEQGLKKLYEQSNVLFIEVGPGTTLSTFANQSRTSSSNFQVINLVKHPKDEMPGERYLLERLGMLWLKGIDINWDRYYPHKDRDRVPIPTYSFNRSKFWLDEEDFRQKRHLLESGKATGHSQTLLYKPCWIPEGTMEEVEKREFKETTCILFADNTGIANDLARSIEPYYREVMMVRRSDTCRKIDKQNYTFDFGQVAHWKYFFDDLDPGKNVDIGYCHLLNSRVENISRDIHVNDITGFDHLLTVLKTGNRPIRLLWFSHQSADVPLTGFNFQNAVSHGAAQWLLHRGHIKSYRRIEVDLVDFDHPICRKRNMELLTKEFLDTAGSTFVNVKAASRSVFKIDYPLAESQLPKSPLPQRRHLLIGDLDGKLVQTLGVLHDRGDEVVFFNTSPAPPEEQWHLWQSGSVTNEQKRLYLTELDLWKRNSNRQVSLKSALEIERDQAGELHGQMPPRLTEMVQQLSTALICHYFQSSGINMEVGKVYTFTQCKRELDILPKFNKFFNFFVQVLVEDGLVSVSGDRIEIIGELPVQEIIETVHTLLEKDYPGALPIYDLVMHCTAHYKQALSGEIPSIAVLFPGGSSELLDAVSQKDSWMSSTGFYIERIIGLVSKYIDAVVGQRPVKILEVGAGRGELTKALLPVLKGLDVSYFFTDIGSTFVNEAQKNFSADYDFVNFQKFDACADPMAQGLEPFTFDIILSLDVIHATPSLVGTITNLQSLLVPGGWMGLLENTSSLRLVNLAWGLADGWWDFEDGDIRQVTPLISVEKWLNLLRTLDFEVVESFTAPGKSLGADHDLLLMQAPSAGEFNAYHEHLIRPGVAPLNEIARMLREIKEIAGAGRFKFIQGVPGSTLKDALQLIMDPAAPFNDIIYQPGSPAPGEEVIERLWQIGEFAHENVIHQCLAVTDANHYLGVQGELANTKIHSLWPSMMSLLNLCYDPNWCHFAYTQFLETSDPGLTGQLTLAPQDQQAVFAQFFHGKLPGSTIVSKVNPTLIPTAPGHNKPIEDRGSISSEERPRSHVEEVLTGIWKEVFGKSHIGLKENYFELGGDSLMLVTVIAQVEKNLQVKVKVSEFYAHPTISSLAKLITGRQGNETRAVAIPVAPRQPSYVTTSAQKTMFYLQFLHPGSTAYNITQVMELHDGVNRDKLLHCLNGLVERHETLRTVFKLSKGEPRQEILEKYKIDLEYYKVEKGDIKEIVSEFTKPFDLLKEPCFRAAFAENGKNKYLLVDLHHILCDGISIDVLKKELSDLYNDNSLPGLGLQFKDYAEWQKSADYKAYYHDHKHYWQEQFLHEPPGLKLPYDFEKDKFSIPYGDHYVADIQGDLLTAMRNLMKTTSTTLFAQLLSVTYIVVAKYARVEDLVIGTGTVGRNFPGLDKIIGNFVNTVPIRSQPASGKTYETFMQEVQHNVNQALEHQDYPYEDLVATLPYKVGKDNRSLFDVAVTLVSSSLVDQSDSEEAKLIKRFVDHFDSTSKFDIDVNAVEKEDRVTIVIEYASTVFKEDTIARFFLHMKEVIGQVTPHPGIELGEIVLSGLPQKSNDKDWRGPGEDSTLEDRFFDHKY